ncbi:MAG: cysteine peptidase family C39 domain-containing protein [Deltaproteobacteria bacterium]|nr:cysteine peptidase family C39 domain-containing protein [Deltaproteobacteria bacterium]
MKFWLLGVVLGLGACAPAVVNQPPTLATQDAWNVVPHITPVIQTDRRACGLAAAQMVVAHWDKPVPVAMKTGDNGVRAGQIKQALEASGLLAFVIAGSIGDLQNETAKGRPVIVGVAMDENQRRYGHFVVVVGTSPVASKLMLIDPQRGYVVQRFDEFAHRWNEAGNVAIVAAP